MNKELEIFATTLNEIVKDLPDNFYIWSVDTADFVDNLIEDNKEYDYIYDEDNEIKEKNFKGYKDENLNKVLERIKKSLEKDEARRDEDREKLDKKVFSKLGAIKRILKIYAIDAEENK